MYRVMTERTLEGDWILPEIHLFNPTLVEYEVALIRFDTVDYVRNGGESSKIAIHGHPYNEMCGGKEQWTQLCHMARFIPTGVEKEAFDKKWNYLYVKAEERLLSEPPVCDDHGELRDGPRLGTVRLGKV